MAEPKKSGGLLAIIGGPPKGEGDSEDEKPSTAKGRALKSMWDNMQAGDFEEASSAFQDAYDACAMGGDEPAGPEEETPFDEE